MNKQDELATKQDVEEIVQRVTHQVVGDVVGGIVGDAMQLIAERFDKVDVRLNNLETTTTRIEDKLDATIVIVDEHSLTLKRLDPQAA